MAGLNSQQSFSGLDEVMSDLGKVEQALKNIGSSSPKKNPQNPVRNGASEGQRSPPAQLGMSATASPATDRAIREQALRFEADKKILEARLVREKQEVEQRLLREKRELEEAYARERQSASDRSRQDRRELEESLSRERLEVSRLTQLLSDLPPPLSSRSSSSADESPRSDISDDRRRADMQSLHRQLQEQEAARMIAEKGRVAAATELSVLQERLRQAGHESLIPTAGASAVASEITRLRDNCARLQQDKDQLEEAMARQRAETNKYMAKCLEIESSRAVLEVEAARLRTDRIRHEEEVKRYERKAQEADSRRVAADEENHKLKQSNSRMSMTLRDIELQRQEEKLVAASMDREREVRAALEEQVELLRAETTKATREAFEAVNKAKGESLRRMQAERLAEDNLRKIAELESRVSGYQREMREAKSSNKEHDRLQTEVFELRKRAQAHEAALREERASWAAEKTELEQRLLDASNRSPSMNRETSQAMLQEMIRQTSVEMAKTAEQASQGRRTLRPRSGHQPAVTADSPPLAPDSTATLAVLEARFAELQGKLNESMQALGDQEAKAQKTREALDASTARLKAHIDELNELLRQRREMRSRPTTADAPDDESRRTDSR
eukprot:TRINITY_DN1842_c0_g1_i2.p1 TRINITY_DN1842_c0_g1~~TRINITY_DN1842_c0_g1_i2.p1  ORF type:complete len:619 (-),score=179.27 TRINITY_DN1842_c0_g1_i2:891-2747(-)